MGMRKQAFYLKIINSKLKDTYPNEGKTFLIILINNNRRHFYYKYLGQCFVKKRTDNGLGNSLNILLDEYKTFKDCKLDA